MMGFDSATSSFLALLKNKSYRKQLKKTKKKGFHLRSKKKFKSNFCLNSSVKKPISKT